MKLQSSKIVLVLSQVLLITITTTQALNNQTIYALRIIDRIFMNVPDRNIIISPAALKTTLTLIYLGALGDTANELSRGILLPDKAHVLSEAHKLKFKTRNFPKGTFTMANQVFVSEKYSIRPSYEVTTRYYFDAAAEKLDFSDAEKTVKTINNWINERTNNKMSNALNPNDVGTNIIAMLVNAIYFKGQWLKPFDAKATTKKDFYISKTKTKKVDMMVNYGLYPYAEIPEMNAKALVLNYKDSDIRMFLLLPNENDEGWRYSPRYRRSTFNHSKLSEFTNELQYKFVHISIPKFKFEFSVTLRKTFEELGVMNLFTKSANMNKMFVDGRNLYISKVIHSAFIEVNEQGTVADGAAAAVNKNETIPRVVVNEFNANRPFFFLLLDKTEVFFVGQVKNI